MRSLELAREEITSLVRKPIMIAAFVVMMLIPLLYGALYLWAFWDPYSALDRLPVAVVNLDRPAKTDGETVAAGADLVDELIETGTFDWQIVSAETARHGVRSGTYYASLTVPRDFSSLLAQADSDSPARPKLLVSLHESKNMIAAQIEAKVFGEVRKAASASASKSYFDTVFIAFDEVRIGLSDARDGASELAEGLDDAAAGSHRLEAGARKAASGGAELAQGIDALADGSRTLNAGVRKATRGTSAIADGSSELASGTAALAAGAKRTSVGAEDLATGLVSLNSGVTSLAAAADSLARSAAQVDAGVATVDSRLQEAAASARGLSTGATGVPQLLQAIATKYPDMAADPLFQEAATTAGSVASGSETLAGSLGDASDSIGPLSAGVHRVSAGASLLAQGAGKLSSASAQAASGAKSLAGGITSISSGGAGLATGAKALEVGARTAADGMAKLGNGSGLLTSKLAQADKGSSKLASGLSVLRHGTGELNSGLSAAADGSQELAHGLATGADDVPAYSESGRAARASMMSDPVELRESKIGEVATYGTGFAPYFIPLALWVGMLIVFVLLAPIPERAARSGANAAVTAMTGMWPAIVIGLGQSALMYVVLRFGLGLEPVNPPATFGLVFLTSVVFAAVMQWLGAAFGAVGKLIGIVILMLQLTSAAGTFPLETLPSFFRTVSPWLPMTHAVAALRESISGGDIVVMAHQAWLLALFGVAAFTGTVWAARNAHAWSGKRLAPSIEL